MTLRRLIVAGLVSFIIGIAPPGTSAAAQFPQSDALRIASIRLEGREVAVTVDVPAGIKRVVLEARRRLGSGSWEPVAIQRFDDAAIEARVGRLRIPLSAEVELLRVRGDSGDALPTAFYRGTNSFGTPTSEFAAVNRTGALEEVAAAPKADATAAPSTQSREVVESDIWKIEGDTLYFFNQYRGLQVIDIAKPDQPVVRGTYVLPAAGEQMYVMSPNRVVLLAHDFCGWGTTAESQIILIDLNGGQMKASGQMSVPGTLRETRMVGTALYVVSERYRPILIANAKGGAPEQAWEWGSQISSFDLSQITSSDAKFVEWVPGYGNAIQATDRFLFVATPQQGSNVWSGNSDVRVFDISSPDGAMKALGTVHTVGRVKDKFKMQLNGNVFTAVTETSGSVLKTQVETFSLADPANPQKLGFLPIIEREALFATRFDGDRLYVVTFLRIDPLWIIDLSDPSQPRKLGELEIPGWSTYIQPLGDRLVTIGIDASQNRRVSVQLFDVHDAAKPALLSKVLVGDGYSSSEANVDEKAFGVLPDQKLVLVPFSSWNNQGNVQGVQLIDLEQSTLRKRGVIEHQFQARRATVHRDRILSISAVELLSVDATDRDRPRVVATTDLSSAADRVFAQGDHLIMLAQGQNGQPILRVALASDPDTVLKKATLGELPLLGAAVRDQRLYLLQGKSTEVIWPKVWTPTNYFGIGTNAAALAMSVFDLRRLPDLPLLAQDQQTFAGQTKYWNQFEAVWPKSGLLVWSSRGYGNIWLRGGIVTDVVVGAPASIGGRFAPIWWGGSDSSFIAYDVNNATALKLASEFNIRGTNNWWNFSQAFTANGLLYISHQTTEFAKDIQLADQVYQQWDGSKYTLVTNKPPIGAWVERYFLDVLSYADPTDPILRKPASIPGALIGLGRDGNLVFTQAYRYADAATFSDRAERIDASSYDGVEARLVDSLRLPTNWPHPALVRNDQLFLGRPADTNISPAIEVWKVDDFAKFNRLGETQVKNSVQALHALGEMLVSQSNNEIRLFAVTTPASLATLGSGVLSGCLGYNLTYADGSPDRGLWIPLGAYGLKLIETKP